MQIYLPIAEMAVSGEMILFLGAFVGFLSGVFGVGGGFLTTPILIFMGLPPAVVVGTQASQLVASSVSGVMSHFQKGNVDVRMGMVMLGGGFIGASIGVMLFKLLQYLGQIDLAISMLYVLLLGTIGSMMMYESLRAVLKKRKGATEKSTSLAKSSKFLNSLPYKIRFHQSKLYMSVFIPGGVGFVGGILVSVLGIGGGFILVPAMIYIIGMPTLMVAGTSLFQIIFTSAFAVLLHAVANHTVDMILAGILIVGGVVGAQLGVRVSKYVKGASARVILAAIILAVAIRLAMSLLIIPDDMFSVGLG